MRLSLIGILSYIIPALMSVYIAPMYGYSISTTGIIIIITSLIASTTGYAFSFVYPAVRPAIIKNPYLIHSIFPNLIMITGIFSMLLNFYLYKSIPILSTGEGRVLLQESILWNIYILCSIGVFLHSRNAIYNYKNRYGLVLVFIYIILSLLTAWKGTFLFILIIYFSPRFKGRYVPLFKFSILFSAVASIFIAINYTRSDIPLTHVLMQPIYYIIWGFVNFDHEAIETYSSCIHSIPIVGCQFSVNNDQLIIPTWNVFTSLSPIYIDGGLILVFLFFFFLSLWIGILERKKSTLINDYIYFVILYFFIFSHNGYSFYSKSFFISILIVFVINAIINIKQNKYY